MARDAVFELRHTDGSVCVTCLSGAVEVALASGGATLAAAQRLVYDAAGLQPARALDADDLPAWREGFLRFRQAPLAQVLDEINRYRSGRVILMAQSLAARPVSVRVELARLDTAIAQIRENFQLDATALPGGVLLLLRRARWREPAIRKGRIFLNVVRPQKPSAFPASIRLGRQGGRWHGTPALAIAACAGEIRMRRSLEMGGDEQARARQDYFECGRQASGRAAGAAGAGASADAGGRRRPGRAGRLQPRLVRRQGRGAGADAGQRPVARRQRGGHSDGGAAADAVAPAIAAVARQPEPHGGGHRRAAGGAGRRAPGCGQCRPGRAGSGRRRVADRHAGAHAWLDPCRGAQVQHRERPQHRHHQPDRRPRHS